MVITFPTSARVTLVSSGLHQLLVSSLLLCTRPQNVLFVSDNTSKLSRVELRACYHLPSHIMSVIFIRMASACQICRQICSLHVALPFPLGCFWTRHHLLLASLCLSLLSELTCLSYDGSLLNHSDWIRPELLGANWYLSAHGTPILVHSLYSVSPVWSGFARGRTEFCLCSFN